MMRNPAGPPSPNPTANPAGVGKGLALPCPLPSIRAFSVRRRLSAALALTVGAALTLTGLATVSTPPAAASLPTVAAGSSDALADAWGIKTITSGAPGSNPWNDQTRVMAALSDLGVRHIRTPLFHGNRGQLDYLKRLQSAGVTALVTMGRPDGQGGTVPQLVNDAAAVPGSVFAVEGANEWDLHGGSGWAANLRAYQKNLYTTMKANPALKGKPVYGPSIGHEEDYAALGDVSAWLDKGNIHTYPGGWQPSQRLDVKMSESKPNRGSKPVMFGETGYHNYMQDTSTHLPAPEGVAGVYYPRMVLEGWRRGVTNTFSYQLLDNRPGQTGVVDNRESHFGLIRNDWSRKPAFNAMANFEALVRDPGAGFAPAPLAYATTGGPSDLKQVLVAKRDGSHILFLWRDV